MEMRDRRRVAAMILAGMVLAGGGFFVGTRVRAGAPAPGSAEDPLVSKSYVDEVVRTNVDQRLNQVEVVSLQPGQILRAEGGTELVLRVGQVTVIAGPGGGLSDLTAGVDLNGGAVVSRDHLLLVPRSDGRGVRATTGALLLVRGRYVVK